MVCDDGVRKSVVTFPIVGIGIDGHVFHRGGYVVSGVTCSFTAVVPGNDDPSAIRIEKKFRRIEVQTARQIEGAHDSKSVSLTQFNAGHKDVPLVVSTIRIRVEMDDPGRSNAVFMVEEQQLHAFCIVRVKTEVRAAMNWGGSERRTVAHHSCVRHGLPKADSLRYRTRNCLPDFGGVFRDCPVRRELARTRNIQDGHARPCVGGAV